MPKTSALQVQMDNATPRGDPKAGDYAAAYMQQQTMMSLAGVARGKYANPTAQALGALSTA